MVTPFKQKPKIRKPKTKGTPRSAARLAALVVVVLYLKLALQTQPSFGMFSPVVFANSGVIVSERARCWAEIAVHLVTASALVMAARTLLIKSTMSSGRPGTAPICQSAKARSQHFSAAIISPAATCSVHDPSLLIRHDGQWFIGSPPCTDFRVCSR